MRYIIEVYVQESIKDLESFEKALRKFLDTRMNYPNTFEVHGNKYALYNEVYTGNMVRFCTTQFDYCYPLAKISGYDFNSEIGKYFIAIDADEKFKTGGVFYPRILANADETHKVNEIVGLDYIVKGVELHEGKN